MAKILYVEDDTSISRSVIEWFSREGHLVESVTTAEDGLQCTANFNYDVILLDWDLPDKSGLEFCRAYRKSGGTSWVIFLTGMSSVANKITGLEEGADDYLAKPFEIRELSARINSGLRRAGQRYTPLLRIDDVELDLNSRKMKVGEQEVRLMPKEIALLEYLMRNPGCTFSTKVLLASVWPSESDASEGTVRTFLLNLRKKLAAAGKPDFIKTVLGSGYTIGS